MFLQIKIVNNCYMKHRLQLLHKILERSWKTMCFCQFTIWETSQLFCSILENCWLPWCDFKQFTPSQLPTSHLWHMVENICGCRIKEVTGSVKNTAPCLEEFLMWKVKSMRHALTFCASQSFLARAVDSSHKSSQQHKLESVKIKFSFSQK